MSGDNVIRPIFGSKRTEIAAGRTLVPVTPSGRSEAPDFEQDMAYCLSNLEQVWNAHLRGDEMTTYLFDVVGYSKNDSSLQLRRPVVSTYTFEQFCDRLLISSRAEWSAQPAFYGALFIEFHERQNFILLALESRRELVHSLSEEDRTILIQITLRAEI